MAGEAVRPHSNSIDCTIDSNSGRSASRFSEITDAVSMLAAKHAFHVVRARYWLPIGTVEAWEAAQMADVSPVGSGPSA